MISCPHCTKFFEAPRPANDAPATVIRPRASEVIRRSYVRRLAIATADLGLSRREIPNWLASVIYGYEGVILSAETNQPISVNDLCVDDVFGDDLSFRWLGDLMAFAERDPVQDAQRRVAPRLQMMALAFHIAKPDVARHFRR